MEPNALQQWLDRAIRAEELRILSGATTSTTAAPPKNLDVDTFLREMDQFLRESGRKDVTITVVLGHVGPPVSTRHPTDGTFIECGYLDALAIHKEVPLSLHRVIDEGRAEFKVAGPFWTVPRLLPAPPYGGGVRDA